MKPQDESCTSLEILGEEVANRRKALNLSQEALAQICGFDRTYISMVERGKRNISFNNLLALSRGLEVKLSDLTRRLDGS